ncbi:hypothetical protein BY996DRAFT_6583653 [Phakopsora pachyrhizi]|nr:hypothetical protein BY996DRAFT_6583653 [Phakopsora pachyrhizi]
MPRPQKNHSDHLTTEDYSIICMWLSKPSNFSACFGQAGKTTVGRPPASNGNVYALMAAEVNQKSKSGLKISSKQMKEHDSTGFGVSEDDQSKGIITISQMLNNICPCFEQMDVIFALQPNITPPSVADTRKNSIETITMVDEHIDENLPNLGESPFDNAAYSQDNTFEEREEEMKNIQSSNSLNLNPDSSDLSYECLSGVNLELQQEMTAVTKLNWEQQKWHLEKEQKDKEQPMELTELEVRMFIADKDCEAMKLKEDNALLLAVAGSSRSFEEITEISKILFNR